MYSLHEVEHILRNKQVFVCSLAFLGEGEHSEAFLVNRDIVVKLPKHRQASECLKTEMQVVKGLGTKLNVEIPNVLFQGAFFHEGEEYTFFGSRKLPGHSLNKKQFCALPKPILDKNAEIVANFLYRLHSEKNVLPIQREGDVLVHGDFSLNHLLFDQNQMVCSVLDFGDSHVGDYQGELNGIPNAAVIFSYPKDGFGNPKALRVFLSTNVELSTQDILDTYTKRWPIELFFRQSKSKLALDSYQIRSRQGIQRYWLIMSLVHYLCCMHSGNYCTFEEGYASLKQQLKQEQFANLYRLIKSSASFEEAFKFVG